MKLETEVTCGVESESLGVTQFEEAVFLGSNSNSNSNNSSSCEVKYNICPLSKDDIIFYVNKMF